MSVILHFNEDTLQVVPQTFFAQWTVLIVYVGFDSLFHYCSQVFRGVQV